MRRVKAPVGAVVASTVLLSGSPGYASAARPTVRCDPPPATADVWAGWVGLPLRGAHRTRGAGCGDLRRLRPAGSRRGDPARRGHG